MAKAAKIDCGLGPLGQIARPVRNLDSACRFFAEQMGLKLLYRFPGLAFFDLGGIRLMLSEAEADTGASLLYFRTADIHTACATFQSRGVTFLDAPHRIHRHADGTEEWMAFFNDDEGRPLALMGQFSA